MNFLCSLEKLLRQFTTNPVLSYPSEIIILDCLRSILFVHLNVNGHSSSSMFLYFFWQFQLDQAQ